MSTEFPVQKTLFPLEGYENKKNIIPTKTEKTDKKITIDQLIQNLGDSSKTSLPNGSLPNGLFNLKVREETKNIYISIRVFDKSNGKLTILLYPHAKQPQMAIFEKRDNCVYCSLPKHSDLNISLKIAKYLLLDSTNDKFKVIVSGVTTSELSNEKLSIPNGVVCEIVPETSFPERNKPDEYSNEDREVWYDQQFKPPEFDLKVNTSEESVSFYSLVVRNNPANKFK